MFAVADRNVRVDVNPDCAHCRFLPARFAFHPLECSALGWVSRKTADQLALRCVCNEFFKTVFKSCMELGIRLARTSYDLPAEHQKRRRELHADLERQRERLRRALELHQLYGRPQRRRHRLHRRRGPLAA